MKITVEVTDAMAEASGLDRFRRSEAADAIAKGFDRLFGQPGCAKLSEDQETLTIDAPDHIVAQLLLTYALDVDGPLPILEG